MLVEESKDKGVQLAFLLLFAGEEDGTPSVKINVSVTLNKSRHISSENEIALKDNIVPPLCHHLYDPACTSARTRAEQRKVKGIGGKIAADS